MLWMTELYRLCIRIQIMQSDGEEKWCQTDRPSNEERSLPLPFRELTASGLRFKQRQDVKLHHVLTPVAVLSRKKEAKQQRRAFVNTKFTLHLWFSSYWMHKQTSLGGTHRHALNIHTLDQEEQYTLWAIGSSQTSTIIGKWLDNT